MHRRSGREDFEAVLAGVYDRCIERHRFGRRPWGRALQRSDVVRHIVVGVVRRGWPDSAGHAPGRADVPTPQLVHLTCELVARHWVDIEQLCRCGMSVSSTVVDELARRGVDVSPGQASERIAVRLARSYGDTGNVPDKETAEAIALAVADGMAKARRQEKLTWGEFPAAVGSAYDEEWERTGSTNLARHPPSTVGLGYDRRPPLRPAAIERRAPGDWYLGLDRSVYGRYRLYWKTSGSCHSPSSEHDEPAEDTCCTEHERSRDLAAVDSLTLALTEVARACAPFGLQAAEHHAVVRSIRYGFDPPDAHPDRDEKRRALTEWHQWASSRCAPVEAVGGCDEGLVHAVAAFGIVWRCTSTADWVAKHYGSIASNLEDAVAGLNRKVWMELHRREREYLQPVRRRHVVKAIRLGFSVGVVEALRRRFTGQVPRPPVDPSIERLEETTPLLVSVRDRVAAWRDAVLTGDLSWADEYDEIVSGAPGSRSSYLSVAELADVLSTAWRESA